MIIVYSAVWLGGPLAIDDESSEIRQFAAADIPWHELAFPSTKDALRDYFAARAGTVDLSPPATSV